MVFSFEDYKEYVENLRKNGIKVPIIPGIRPLTELKQAESVEKFFGLKVNDELKGLLKQGKGLDYTVDMIKKLKKFGAPGVHLFVLNDIDRLSLSKSTRNL